jgi:predicted ATPase/DNA-binding CsgD family transcriptional regulator
VGNLPYELTSFVGRRREVSEAKRLLSDYRLVTLTGPGGVGKTRLALKVAAEVRRAFGDRVWLVQLDQLQDPALLVDTVAQSLGLHEQSTRRLMVTLGECLDQRRVLLVLDNCEHLVDAVAALADTLLRSCRHLWVLATSREPLSIGGEATLAVPTLSVPDPRPPCSPRDLSRFEAVTLLADRAAAVAPGFSITEANADAVAEICYRLDGLPLAIELVAVRLRALSEQEIARRLSDRYRLLTTGPRGASTRQQTLESCMQWSYDLCSAQEQLLWARLAVFTGGFELGAAQGICAGADLAAEDMLDLVASLVDKSILIPERHGPVMRYRLLETIREFGRAKLHQTGEHAAMLRRHRGWYASFVARVNVALCVGFLAWQQGDSRRATDLLEQSLRLKRGMDDFLATGWCLEALAWIAAGEHDHQRAATLLGAAEALSQAESTPTTAYYYPDLPAAHEQCERRSRRALGDVEFQAAFRHGRSLTVEDAIGYALGETLQTTLSPADTQEALTQLTRREYQVAGLVAEGLSNKDIASRLVISQRTAESHVENILAKLNFTSRARIAAWAARLPIDTRTSERATPGSSQT